MEVKSKLYKNELRESWKVSSKTDYSGGLLFGQVTRYIVLYIRNFLSYV